MSAETIHIREIEIHRTLGIRQGEGFALAEISPGVNLLFGSNGSGKTTTCRVVQELLWPGGLHRPTLRGIIRDGDNEWRIDIDAGHAQAHHNGRTAAMPDFGSRENRSRYLLGLKDLIVEDNNRNADFAKAISDASQGGYDLEKAADDLGFRARPKSRRSECDRVQEKNRQVEEARRRQIKVEGESKRLAELRQQLDEAIEAARELALLNKARDYHVAAARCHELMLEIKAYPNGVGRLQGDERKQLDALAEEEKVLLSQRTAEEERRRRAEKDLDGLDLPEGGVPDEQLRELRALKRSLREIETRINELRRKRDEAVGKSDEALRRLGDHFTEDQLALIESIETPDLGEFARRVHRLRGKEDILTERRSWLSREEPEETRSFRDDELREGITALTRWLASSSGSRVSGRPSWLSGIAVLILVLSGIALAVSTVLLWTITVLVAIVLFAIDWRLSKRRSMRSDVTPRQVHRDSFASLSLPEPDAWNDEMVLSRLRDLVRWAGTKALFEERRMKLDQMKTEEEGLVNAREELERERQALKAQLGIALEIGDEWLPVLVDRVRGWQEATLELAAVEAALAVPERERDALVDQIKRSLSTYGYEPAETSDAVDENIADLERRRNLQESAREALERADERIEESIKPGLEKVATKRYEIFSRLGIEGNREAILDDWLDRYPGFRELKENLAIQEAVRDDRAAALVDRTDLLELDRTEVEVQTQRLQAMAETRDDLSETIGEINRQIKDAKAGHALTDALEHRDDALQTLTEARDENGRAVAGAMLTDWVRQEAVERSRPHVFQRANELFVRFTRGTLCLEMDDRAAPPAFVARRGSFPFQSLNELSDGERIQLMTAVRLAFLEQDEARRLPLLVDEVLGTSDDGRSGVLIDTMIDIARQGRQVFYCTAQHDEVGKWKARLMESDVPFKVLDLGEIRGGAAHRSEPLEIAVFETADPPAPEGMSYEEYRDALGVPGLDPGAETMDGVHLWHVLGDSDVLFELLRNNITTWSQLRTLIDHGGAGLVETKNGTFESAKAASKALGCACEAYRIGRGKPIDRMVLLESECISDRFIDEVAELSRRLDGKAAAVIHALDNRMVSNWRSDNTDRLREYLEEEGYLSMQPPLTQQDLRVRVLAAVADELHAGLIEHAVIDRIVAEMYSTTVAEAEAA